MKDPYSGRPPQGHPDRSGSEPYLDREERKAARRAEQRLLQQRRAFLAAYQLHLKRQAQQAEQERLAEPRRFVDL